MARRKKKPADRVVKSRADLMTEGVRRPSIVVKPQNVLIGLDRSSSMLGAALADARSAASSLAEELAYPSNHGAFKLGLITYNHQADYTVPFTEASEFRVPTLGASGGTNFTAAIEAALAAFSSAPAAANAVRPAWVFLTDGQHEHGPDPMTVIDKLKAVADVVCVGLGDGPDMTRLKELASRPEFVTRAKTGAELRSYFAAVGKSLSASRASGGLVSGAADPFASRRL